MDETGSFTLVMRTTNGGERPFPLQPGRTIVGRDVRCAIRVALPNVAPRHCEIVVDHECARVSDMGSPWGTLLNGQRTKSAVLQDMDVLSIGPVEFEVRLR